MSNEKEKLGSSAVRESDSESFQGPTVHHGEGPLHRQLKNRHIAMISIGGVIGTGKFFDAHPTNFPSIDIFFSRSFPGYRWRFITWWPGRSPPRLYHNGYDLLFCHGGRLFPQYGLQSV